MKVSIITVSLNSAEYIEACIQSVINQDYKNIEYIVIDGGSTDGTLDIVRRYEDKISTLISEPDRGIYDAMNKGIAMALGDIVGLLNSDDVYADSLVIEKAAGIFRDSSIDICYGDLVYVDRCDLEKVIRYWRSCEYEDGLFCQGWAPPHPTFFVRRKVYEMYGVFDLDYSMGNDVDLMMRLLGKCRLKSIYIPDVLVKMRTGGASNKHTLSIIRQNMEIFRSGRKNDIKICPPVFIISKIIARISQYIFTRDSDIGV